MKIVSFGGLQWSAALFLQCWWGSIVEGQRLATQKCREYQNVVVNRHIVIPLIIDPTPINFEVFNCTNVVQLIVGGEEARYGEFPHHALLGYRKEGGKKWDYDFQCGGTLISEQHVLTAAHCFGNAEPDIVRLGEYNTALYSAAEYDSEIDSFRKHPGYRFGFSYHDIALIKLKHPISLSKHIRPACLWETEERNTSRYIATGFGLTETLGSALSTVMMKVQLEDVSLDECDRRLKNRKFPLGLRDGQFCVGSSDGGRDTCTGDSGGPLQVLIGTNSCTYAVVGITGTGTICGSPAAVYTKVSHYIDWIEDNVWGANAL